MNELELIEPTENDCEKIAEYLAEFSADRMRVTLDPHRIPGLDHLEKFAGVSGWLQFCRSMSGKITWYLSERKNDGRLVGAACLRHRLEYDDDDIEFASHIGYSIRPGERGKGYAKEQLHLVLQKAKALGITPVRIVCRDSNTGSIRTILANGGKYIDSLYGEESGLTINRYDIEL